MKVLCVLVAVLAAVVAQYEVDQDFVNYPAFYVDYQPRHRRDVSYDRRVGQNGKVFGTLGSNDAGLFGKGGYQHNVFNDGRGRLDASAHGTRVLSPYGDSSHLGGSLNWKNPNAAASLDLSKQIHGPASVDLSAGGRWPIGKTGDVTANGFYSQTQGRGRDYGGRVDMNYRF